MCVQYFQQQINKPSINYNSVVFGRGSCANHFRFLLRSFRFDLLERNAQRSHLFDLHSRLVDVVSLKGGKKD